MQSLMQEYTACNVQDINTKNKKRGCNMNMTFTQENKTNIPACNIRIICMGCVKHCTLRAIPTKEPKTSDETQEIPQWLPEIDNITLTEYRDEKYILQKNLKRDTAEAALQLASHITKLCDHYQKQK